MLDHTAPLSGKLSLIIPVLNEAASLPGLLQQLQSLRRQGAEVVVVDGGSRDGSPGIAERGADQVLTGPCGRASQMNIGAACARGTMLVFLHADAVARVGWRDLLATMALGKTTWGFFPVRFEAGRTIRLIGSFMNLRSRITGIGTGDQCLFVHSALFAEIGGFAEQPLMEDVEICRRLKRHGRPVIPGEPVGASPRRWQRDGVMRTVLMMWCLRLAYFLGVSPQKLHAVYYRRSD